MTLDDLGFTIFVPKLSPSIYNLLDGKSDFSTARSEQPSPPTVIEYDVTDQGWGWGVWDITKKEKGEEKK